MDSKISLLCKLLKHRVNVIEDCPRTDYPKEDRAPIFEYIKIGDKFVFMGNKYAASGKGKKSLLAMCGEHEYKFCEETLISEDIQLVD